MKRSMPTPFGEPDPIAEVAKVAEVVFKLEALLFGRVVGNAPPPPDAPADLLAVERELFWWEMCERYLRLVCSQPSKCVDLRCRRRKSCRKRDEICLAVQNARFSFGVQRAKAPPPPEAQPPAGKKGRNGVRP